MDISLAQAHSDKNEQKEPRRTCGPIGKEEREDVADVIYLLYRL